ncbi:hypothetical protein OG784_12715 [Streptomyces sp. NBC_01617]|uniref:hypothetical protein n=1 Tax=Streptomyces sp. NBC_01617 TaxID=2975899 RepID=UPI0038655BD2|nr:hypothetical protein OG784_12715 [Streptomyces sp. NBC_01617]
MARTGPQKIPGASQQYFYGSGRYSGSDMEVNCGVAHTTEGMTVPSYSSGAEAPNVTGMPDFAAKKIRWHQHFDVDESARALMNKSGGVETNTANAFQIELVGTCDSAKAKTWGGKKAGVHYIYWPDAPDWALAEVAWLVRWLHDYHGVPLTCVKNWLAYGLDSRRPGVTPASYGANPARMSMTAWRNFTGWCGHQHVPENDHGDPGSMNFARVIALAKGTTHIEEEDPMAGISKQDIYDAVWKTDQVKAPTTSTTLKTNPTWAPASILTDIVNNVRAIRAAEAGQTAAITALAKLVGSGVDTAAVVTAVQAAIKDAVIDVNINSKDA